MLTRSGRLRSALLMAAAYAASMPAAARAHLPPEARIRATVHVVIKPRTNSFVFEVRTNPAIFLYLDPARTGPQFENTVAHELHHIGFASVQGRTDSIRSPIACGRRRSGWGHSARVLPLSRRQAGPTRIPMR